MNYKNRDQPPNDKLTNEAIQALIRFSQNRSTPSSSVINSIYLLCKSSVSLDFKITGYHYCVFCAGWLAQTGFKLNCPHSTHKQCLQNFALQNSENTLDPLLLEKMTCPRCVTPILVETTNKILGKEFIDNQMAISFAKLSKQIEEEQKLERKRRIEAMKFDCPICMNKFKIEEMVTFSCPQNSHRYCKQCATSSVQELIKNGKYLENELVCQQCKSPIEQQILRNLLPKNEFENLTNLRHKNLKVEGLNMHGCLGYLYKDGQPLMAPPDKFATTKDRNNFLDELQRRCSAIRAGHKPAEVTKEVQECPGIISCDPKVDDGFIMCYICGLETCIKGCESAHRGSTCERYEQWKNMVKLTDAQTEASLKQAKMQKCPRCKMIVLKEVGCHHITCRCGEQFCYVCGALWAGHRSCPGR